MINCVMDLIGSGLSFCFASLVARRRAGHRLLPHLKKQRLRKQHQRKSRGPGVFGLEEKDRQCAVLKIRRKKFAILNQ